MAPGDPKRPETRGGSAQRLHKRTIQPALQSASELSPRHRHASQPRRDLRDGLPFLVALLDETVDQARTGSVMRDDLLTAARSVAAVRDEWHKGFIRQIVL